MVPLVPLAILVPLVVALRSVVPTQIRVCTHT